MPLKRKLPTVVTLIVFWLLPHTALAWDAVGHQLVARIAWENMSATARRTVVDVLRAAPQDACLLDLFPNDSRPLADREREFFVRSSTWPDIVRPDTRPGVVDTRPCIRFHRRDWHFINFFWKGTSGGTNNSRPQDLKAIDPPDVNAVDQLRLFRPFLVCSSPQCGASPEERAIVLAWILHLVGDIHQPLHTSARVTSTETKGDRGGNLFLLDGDHTLHGYWDGIVKLAISKQQNESDAAYLERVAGIIMQEHPRSQMSSRLQSIDFEAWAREGFETTKKAVYPVSLKRNQKPTSGYRDNALNIAKEAIAIGGYRLAELLNRMFGP